MPNIFNYLAALLTHGQDHGSKLDRILKGQHCIMATLADVQAKLDELNGKVDQIGPALFPIPELLTNIAADLQALKDQVGAAPAGITPEEADGFIATLGATIDKVTNATGVIDTAVSNLQSVADAQ